MMLQETHDKFYWRLVDVFQLKLSRLRLGYAAGVGEGRNDRCTSALDRRAIVPADFDGCCQAEGL